MDTASLGAAGLAPNLRSDHDKYIKAFVDATNRNGGILGRKVIPDIFKVSVLDEAAGRAACLQALDQNQDFAVIDVTALIYTSSQECVTIEHKAPFVTNYANENAVFNKAFPLMMTPNATDEHRIGDGIMQGYKSGYLTPAKVKKLGVLFDTCEPAMNRYALSLLAKIGFTKDKISLFTASCDISTASAQIPQAVAQHKRDGADAVLMNTYYVVVAPYTRQATQQLYHPHYFASDGNGLSVAAETKTFDQDQWDGTMATSSYNFETDPLSPLTKECNEEMRAAGVKPISDLDDSDVEAAGFCENYNLFVKVATLAGPNLTPGAWGQAAQQAGTFSGSLTNFAQFGPRKLSGSDSVTVVRYSKDCQCYRRLTPYVKSTQ